MTNKVIGSFLCDLVRMFPDGELKIESYDNDEFHILVSICSAANLAAHDFSSAKLETFCKRYDVRSDLRFFPDGTAICYITSNVNGT